MLDNVGLRYPHRASGAKAPRTLRPLPLLRFAVSATGGAHLCSIQYYLRFWLGKMCIRDRGSIGVQVWVYHGEMLPGQKAPNPALEGSSRPNRSRRNDRNERGAK